jgi:hypothetical protein
LVTKPQFKERLKISLLKKNGKSNKLKEKKEETTEDKAED